MPAKITFTQAEQDEIFEVLFKLKPGEKDRPNLRKLYDKMVKARKKEAVVFHGISVAKVLEMARTKFGDRFKTPNMITAQWSIKMQKSINDSGVSEETARKAIEACDWVGDIFAQTFIYKLAELAVMAPRQTKLFTNKTKGPPAPSKKSGWLGQLDQE